MANAVYQWTADRGFGVSAQVAGEEISRVRDSVGEFFQPKDVVKASTSPTAPLHKAFEWDDTVAGGRYREHQASAMIRHIAVVQVTSVPQEPIRAFVSVRTEEQFRYTTIAHAFSQPSLRGQVLDRALADFQALERRYAQYLDFAGVRAAFQDARERAMQLT